MTTKKMQKKQRTGAMTKKPSGSHKTGSKNRQPSVIIETGCFAGLQINLKKLRTSFGSDISSDICLDHSFVSHEHAVIVKTGNDYYLEDLGSRYGTSINGKEIHKQKLKKGDRIGIGEFELKFCR